MSQSWLSITWENPKNHGRGNVCWVLLRIMLGLKIQSIYHVPGFMTSVWTSSRKPYLRRLTVCLMSTTSDGLRTYLDGEMKKRVARAQKQEQRAARAQGVVNRKKPTPSSKL